VAVIAVVSVGTDFLAPAKSVWYGTLPMSTEAVTPNSEKAAVEARQAAAAVVASGPGAATSGTRAAASASRAGSRSGAGKRASNGTGSNGRRAAAVAAQHRERLLAGMETTIRQKGLEAATISDVVQHAHVSKRTFYEHFPDKESCFLALFALTSDRIVDAIVADLGPELHWEERLRACIDAYLAGLSVNPSLTTSFLLEVRSAGPRALSLRRAVINRLVDVLLGLCHDARGQDPSLQRVDRETVTAVVGGLNELMLAAVEEQRVHRLAEIGETGVQMLRAALTAPSPSR
jgi:AcrR family transcriptional regulator